MRVGIYNRWLHTAGGGERYTTLAAQMLAQDHEVELITHQPVDLRFLEERLNVDLSRVRLRCVPDLPFDLLGEITADYDLFINGSHFSFVPSRARHSLMFVYFPFVVGHTWDARLRQRVGRHLLRELMVPQFQLGFYGLQELGRGWYRWSAGNAAVMIPVPGRPRDLSVQIVAGSFRPPHLPPVRVRILCAGRLLGETHLQTTRGNYANIDVQVPRECIENGHLKLELESETFCPHDAGEDAHDYRHVGIAVAAVRTRGWRYYLYEVLFERLFRGLGLRLHGIPENASLEYIRTYDLVCPISQYVAKWVQRAWGITGEVLYPPVNVRDLVPGEKKPILLSVGRFFPHSHEKKFPEMVRAFRDLIAEGLAGWELHLAGGVAQDRLSQEYFAHVQKLAQGLPVVLHPNISFKELQDLYAHASIYWHAAGYGENEERHPERFEHFGITVVEAMAAGCVPVVLGKAGLAETVEHEKSGLLWHTLDELKRHTRRVIADAALAERLRAGARARCEAFSEERFAVRLQELVAQVLAGSKPATSEASSHAD